MNLVTIVLPPYKPTGIWFFFFLSHSVSLCPKGRAIINAESPVLQLCPGACWYSSEWQRLCVDHLTTCWREISNALSSHLLLSTPLLSFSSSPLSPPLGALNIDKHMFTFSLWPQERESQEIQRRWAGGKERWAREADCRCFSACTWIRTLILLTQTNSHTQARKIWPGKFWILLL